MFTPVFKSGEICNAQNSEELPWQHRFKECKSFGVANTKSKFVQKSPVANKPAGMLNNALQQLGLLNLGIEKQFGVARTAKESRGVFDKSFIWTEKRESCVEL